MWGKERLEVRTLQAMVDFSSKTQNLPALSRQSITRNNVGIMAGYSEKGLLQLNAVVLGLRTRFLSLLCLGVMAGPSMSPPSCHHCNRALFLGKASMKSEFGSDTRK